ncbi:MAG: hypothetical protein AAAB16_01020 [Pseudomonas sp.]|uniref:hypothetical protein n=1 Tax=Pseudomonas sp. TaxID=306 RepID=UPI0030F2A5BF
MKNQVFASLILASLSASVFALPSDQPQFTFGGQFVHSSMVAEDGADRTGANRVAEGGADRTGANRVAEGGADRTGANRVA